MDHLKNLKYFKQMEELKQITDEDEYKKKEENIIDNLLKTNDIDENSIQGIKILDKSNFSSLTKNNNLFTFMNKEFLKIINESSKKEIEPLNVYFFINNWEHLVYFWDYKKIYKIDYKNKNENEFYLKEYEFNKESKYIIKILKQIYKNEINIQSNIETNLRNTSNNEGFYLINKKFMDNFKELFNYDAIIKHINYDDNTLCSFLKNNHLNLSVDNKIIKPEFYTYNNFNIPINFELLDTESFKSLLEFIIKDKDIISNMNNIYNVSFGDNKIFVQDISNNKINFIYSSTKNNNSNYELLHIVTTEQNNNLSNLFQYSEVNQTFEEFITTYGINLAETNPQIILDENLKKLGDFYNIKPGKRIRLREVNHCLGLENIGATCYMNATIQCLCHILKLKNYFKNRQLVYQDINGKLCPLTSEFYKIVNHLWKDSYKGRKYYIPIDFK